MAENIWDKFDKAIDTESLKKDVADAKENGGSFREVPHGVYEVSIDKLELTESKNHDPMVSIWFKIVSDGDFKGSRIFMNQVITQGFQIHIMDEFLRSLGTDVDVRFNTYREYHEMLLDIFEKISGHMEYALEYGEGKNGFHTYKIKEIYDI